MEKVLFICMKGDHNLYKNGLTTEINNYAQLENGNIILLLYKYINIKLTNNNKYYYKDIFFRTISNDQPIFCK